MGNQNPESRRDPPIRFKHLYAVKKFKDHERLLQLNSPAVIHHLSGYSAHADQQTLCDWVKSMPEPPGEIRLVHGELGARKALRAKLDALY